MPRDYDVKLNRSTMTVMISNGLSKQSSKISKKKSPQVLLLFDDFLQDQIKPMLKNHVDYNLNHKMRA
jgi:hypothetical protein